MSGSIGQPPDDQARRIFLRIRRHQLLAPVNAIIELSNLLLTDQKIQSCDGFFQDLKVVHHFSVQLSEKICELLDTEEIHIQTDDAGSQALLRQVNHDLRGLLTPVIGYSEELHRTAARNFLDSYNHELEQIYTLGKQLTKLIDEVVAYLKGEASPEDIKQWAEEWLPHEEHTGRLSGRILVVDDEEVVRGQLERFLRDQGHEVIGVGDGLSALTLLRTKQESFDLVLLDLVMPGANGFQVLDELRQHEQLRNLPVIVISGLGEQEEVAHCLQLGAEDYLTKPYNPLVLRARIHASLYKKRLRDEAEWERQRFNMLLHDILPAPIVAALAEDNHVPPKRHENVAVLFADLVGFTAVCDQQNPEDVVGDLQHLFVQWEEIANECGVQKIKTIGDAFMAASGLLSETDNPVLDCARCGLRMIQATQNYKTTWDLRVGIHIGPVVAGVLGRRQYLYDLWGDAVNTASRMESNGKAGCINLSRAAWETISHCFRGETREEKEIKGKSKMEIIHLCQRTIIEIPKGKKE